MKREFLSTISLFFFFILVPLSFSSLSGQEGFVQGETLVLSVQVLDELGNPVDGVLVHFYDETDGLLIGERYSDVEGFASVTWDTSSASIGTHRLHIWNDEDPSLYVERSDVYVDVIILSPAELTISVTSPSAVKPDDEFEIIISVSNVGEASALFVEAFLDGMKEVIGNISGGSTSEVSFRVRAQEIPGNYTLKVEVKGIEQGTARELQISKEISYRVKKEGIGLFIQAPSSVYEGSTFAFFVIVRNLGEDLLHFNLKVKLNGASPSLFEKSGSIEAGAFSSFEFSATADKVDKVLIFAEVQSGDLKETASKEIKVLKKQVPQTSPPQPSFGPERPVKPETGEPSQTRQPAQVNSSETFHEETFHQENAPGRQHTNESVSRYERIPRRRGQKGIEIKESNISLGTIGEKREGSISMTSPLFIAVITLLLFSIFRRLWGVEEP